MELLPNNTAYFSRHQRILIFSERYCWTITTYCSRVYSKQYWHFQRVPSKLNCSKNVFQSTYHTISTVSKSYYQTILTYSELIPNSIHTSIELLPNEIANTFLRVWMDAWTSQKFLNGKFSTKSDKS